jgi:hypothetical protein
LKPETSEPDLTKKKPDPTKQVRIRNPGLIRICMNVTFALLYLLLMFHVAVDIYYYGAIKTSYKKGG